MEEAFATAFPCHSAIGPEFRPQPPLAGTSDDSIAGATASGALAGAVALLASLS